MSRSRIFVDSGTALFPLLDIALSSRGLEGICPKIGLRIFRIPGELIVTMTLNT